MSQFVLNGNCAMHSTYIDLELSAIRIFNGGIITLDPLIVDELGCFRVSLVLQRGRQGR
jgi:hypothetical protein